MAMGGPECGALCDRAVVEGAVCESDEIEARSYAVGLQRTDGFGDHQQKCMKKTVAYNTARDSRLIFILRRFATNASIFFGFPCATTLTRKSQDAQRLRRHRKCSENKK
jgi:hypothetical protein